MNRSSSLPQCLGDPKVNLLKGEVGDSRGRFSEVSKIFYCDELFFLCIKELQYITLFFEILIKTTKITRHYILNHFRYERKFRENKSLRSRRFG